MSSNQGGAGRREVAWRVFAAEYDDATVEHSDSDEERAPNYVVTPTGARINRLFVVGVLTEIEQVSDEVLRARIVDPTGGFVVYAGQYQPDAMAFLERADPPAFVAVTGKGRTFQPDDSDVVYTSIRPESINAVDAETRDRWTVQTAEQTLARVGTFAKALESGEHGDALEGALAAGGVDDGLAAGIPLAMDHYGTTEAYLAEMRDVALDAARVVAGERDEVESPSVAPDESGDGLLDLAGARSLVADVDVDVGSVAAADAADAADESAVAGGDTSADDASEDAATVDSATNDDATGSATTDATDSATNDDATGPPTTDATASATNDATPTEQTTADDDAAPDSTTGTDATSAADSERESGDAGVESDAGDEATVGGDESSDDGPGDFDADGDDLDAGGDDLGDFDATVDDEDDLGDFDTGDDGVDEVDDDLGDFDASGDDDLGDVGTDGAATDDSAASDSAASDSSTDASAEEPSFDTDEMYEFEDGERERIEEQFGTEFSTGTEVESPGEAGIETPGTEDADGESEADAGTDASTTTDADAAVESGSAVADESTDADAGSEAGDGDASDGDPSGGGADPGDLEDTVMETMQSLNGDDGVERETLLAAVVDSYDVTPGDVEDALKDALMAGRCYESGEDTLKPI